MWARLVGDYQAMDGCQRDLGLPTYSRSLDSLWGSRIVQRPAKVSSKYGGRKRGADDGVVPPEVIIDRQERVWLLQVR